MYRLKEIKVRKNISDEEAYLRAIKANNVPISSVKRWRIFKKSIDARNKNDVHFVYTIDIDTDDLKIVSRLTEVAEIEFPKIQNKRKSEYRPVIVGAGPAGLFAGLILAQNGVKPIILEQGKSVDERQKDIEEFKTTGKLNVFSNVQFGEGGAGTFSDGKLNTGITSPYCRKVLEEFVNFGAPNPILYMNKPHLGTDNLINIIRNMRNEIIRLGGEFYFNEKVTDFEFENGKLKAVICSKKIETDTAILAIGHSSRDTFEKLYSLGFNMQAKSFSVGVRVEHKQKLINESQYGVKTKLILPPAEYKLVYHGNERSLYTFCMCPGGVVVASSSEERTIVTNGMSYFARNGENANSALLVGVNPEDFAGDSPLRGMYFQKDLEERAFKIGGGNYTAPVQNVTDFLENKVTEKFGEVKPSYLPNVKMTDLHLVLPKFVTDTMEEGIKYFDTKIKGFAKSGVLTGVETRSSSPVRILRDETLQSNMRGIYPCGEGAGYAGGIMSAAVDGIKCAIKILEN